MVKRFMSGKQKFELSKLIVDEYNKTGLTAEKFAQYAAEKLKFAVNVFHVRNLCTALEIKPNKTQGQLRVNAAISYIDKALAGVEQRLIARIEESEKLLAVLEIRMDSLRVGAAAQLQPPKPPQCSGDPANCPENEGFGCCDSAARKPTTVAVQLSA